MMEKEKLLINDPKSNNSEVMRNMRIELLEKQLAFWRHHCTQLVKALDDAEETAKRYAELLEKTEEELYADRVKSEWISVDERLPEREGKYLVYTYKGAIKFGEYRSYLVGEGKLCEPQFDYYVTHWMPLPEAPKGGEE